MIRWQPFVSLMLAALVPSAAYARTPTHVACVGDSITVGVGATSVPKSYPAVLQSMLGSGVVVQNFGVSGATMLSNGDKPYENEYQYYAVTKFVNEAPADAVMDIVIMFGANDSKPQNWTPSGKPKQDTQYVADYKLMIQMFQAAPVKPQIYLMLPTDVGATPCCDISGMVIHDEIIPLIKQLGMDETLPVIDAYTPFAADLSLLTQDNVHPNDAGNAKLAQIVYDGLGDPLPVQGGAGGAPDAGSTAGVSGGGASSAVGAGAGAGGASGSGTASGGMPNASAGSPSSAGAATAGAATDAAAKGSSGCSYAMDAAPGSRTWIAFGILAAAATRIRRRRSLARTR